MSTVIAVVCPHCGNEGMLPKPRAKGASATVQIRIAIAMAEDGTWAAASDDGDLDRFSGNAMMAAECRLEDRWQEPVRRFWLVADVLVPSAKPPEEIPAEIEEQT